MEIEAASALFSILQTESAVRRARASSTKLAHERRRNAAAAFGANAAADGGCEGFGHAASATEQQLQKKQLPVSALVAAAKSLRTLIASAMSIERSVRSASAGAAAAGWGAGNGGGGSGSGSGGVGGGGPSVTRLVRYLTKQCDK